MIEPSDKCLESECCAEGGGWMVCSGVWTLAWKGCSLPRCSRGQGLLRPPHHLGTALLRPDMQSRLGWVQQNESPVVTSYLAALSPCFSSRQHVKLAEYSYCGHKHIKRRRWYWLPTVVVQEYWLLLLLILNKVIDVSWVCVCRMPASWSSKKEFSPV